MIPHVVLSELAARASDILERTAPPFLVDRSEVATTRAASRLQRWATAGAQGDVEALRSTLAARGINLDAVAPTLGGVTVASGAPLPEWVNRFEALFADAYGAAPVARRALTGDAPPGLEVVVTPFLSAAGSRLRTEAWPGVEESALAGLERILLLRLTRLHHAVLAAEWTRLSYERPFESVPARLTALFDERWTDANPAWLLDYPVLARLTELVCHNWLVASREMLHRLTGDRPRLAQAFHAGVPLGALSDVQFGDADLHDGHRAVAILTFASGCRIVYKPRSLVLDAAFRELLQDLASAGMSLPLEAPAVCCRDGYGYAGFVTARRCHDDEESAAFYHRLGALAALTAALGSTDLHYGNVIADGAVPVPIDLETLMFAPLQPTSGPRPAGPAPRPNTAESMLLPFWHKVRGGVVVDRSATAPDPADDATVLSLPCHPDQVADTLRRHQPALLAGFQEMYRWLMAHRDRLSAPGGLLDRFADAELRFVLRETWLYLTLLGQSVDARVLSDGVDRALVLERLNHVSAATHPVVASVVTREREAMLGLDVPRFGMRAHARVLSAAGQAVDGLEAVTSPLESARRRFAALSEQDLDRQLRYVRASIAARLAEPPTLGAWTPTADDAAPTVQALLACAEGICAKQFGAPPSSGEGLIFDSAVQRWVWGGTEPGLAHGAAGAAVVLAALAVASGDARWRERAAAQADLAWQAASALLSSPPRPHVPWLGLEFGIGGLLCAATLLGVLNGCDSIPDRLVDEVSRLDVPGGSRLDAAGGVAGLLIGLLQLHRATGDSRLTGVVERCARFLEAGIGSFDGSRTGWLHGRAGLVLALDRWHSRTPDVFAPDDQTRPGLDGVLMAMIAGDDAGSRVLATHASSIHTFRLGTAGEVDALLWAGRRAGRRDAIDAARSRGAALWKQAEHSGWHLGPGRYGEDVVGPGLFDGGPGIAWALLRLAAPERVPSLAAVLFGEPEILP